MTNSWSKDWLDLAFSTLGTSNRFGSRLQKVRITMVIKNILSELCVSSFGTNAIVPAFIKHAVVRVVPLTQWWLTFCSYYISGAEIMNKENTFLDDYVIEWNVSQMSACKVISVFYYSGNIEYSYHALAFHFGIWLIIPGTREIKISGGGCGFVGFSYFMCATCSRLALF